MCETGGGELWSFRFVTNEELATQLLLSVGAEFTMFIFLQSDGFPDGLVG